VFLTVASTAELSSEYVLVGNTFLAAHVVDGNVFCSGFDTAGTQYERNPWLLIDLKRKNSNINRVVLSTWSLCCCKIYTHILIDNIYVVVGGQTFQESVGILMGTNCAPLLADLF
jgi:hypothetical protein